MIRALRGGARGLWPLLSSARGFLYRRRRTAYFVRRLLDRFTRLQDALLELARSDPEERYKRWIAAFDTLDDSDLSAMREELSAFAEPPLLSLIVPLEDLDESLVEGLAQSLLSQVYDRWVATFVGPPLVPTISGDPRFKSLPAGAKPIAGALNEALRSARTEFVVLLDPRVLLRPHALFLLAQTMQRSANAVLIYADEDAMDENGSRACHYFKPDWNEALLRSQNYLGGFVALRRSRALAVGGVEDELDGNWAWGLFLRITANVPQTVILHLPFVLSHRRLSLPTVEAEGGERRQRVARALALRLGRVEEPVEIEPVGEASYRPHYLLPDRPPTVSVIVPTTCNLEFLRPCLDGLMNRTSYPELEIVVVVNGIDNELPDQRAYLEGVAARPQVRVLFWNERPYNFSRVNNWASEQVRGALVCFLNDDTDVIGNNWLSEMVARVVQNRVAAVGAMLFYPNERIQHAGVILGAGNVAAHNYSRSRRGTSGYHDRALVDQDLSCVTAACMLVRRDVFLSIGGFDEALAIAFNDIDFCLKLRKAGWRVVWTPVAELYHRESASIGRHDAAEREGEWVFESELMYDRWGDDLSSDPYYNPNLSLDPLQLWQPAFPPRVSYPWKPRSDYPGKAVGS